MWFQGEPISNQAWSTGQTRGKFWQRVIHPDEERRPSDCVVPWHPGAVRQKERTARILTHIKTGSDVALPQSPIRNRTVYSQPRVSHTLSRYLQVRAIIVISTDLWTHSVLATTVVVLYYFKQKPWHLTSSSINWSRQHVFYYIYTYIFF